MFSNVTRCFTFLSGCKGKKKVVVISSAQETDDITTFNNKPNTAPPPTYIAAEFAYLNAITHTIPFIPPITYGRVIKVYDGDTITIAAKLPYALSPVYRFSVRLAGIDSPEMRGGGAKETELAQISRDALHSLIYGKIIELRNKGKEKYGRLLADIYTTDDSQHVNQWMLNNKYAVPYDGGKKLRSTEWDN